MSDPRLISFDIWGTLLRGNPEYKQRRIARVAAAFGAGPPETAEALDGADDALDEATLRTGAQYGTAERLAHAAGALGVPVLENTDRATLEAQLNDEFHRNPPTMTEPDILATLARLRSAGLRLAVTSNTGFVPGREMRKMLVRLGVRVDHHVFSDEVGFAKPSRRIFAALPLPDVLHVGDNERADVAGASGAGFEALWYRPGHATDDGVVGCLADLPEHPLAVGTRRVF